MFRKKVIGLNRLVLKREKSKGLLNKKILTVLSVTFLVCLVIEVWTVNRLSSYGAKLNQIKSAQINLELQNQVLENEIAQKTALSYIEKAADSLGFANIKNIEYLNSPVVANAR